MTLNSILYFHSVFKIIYITKSKNWLPVRHVMVTESQVTESQIGIKMTESILIIKVKYSEDSGPYS
jgi:hypothetical protein